MKKLPVTLISVQTKGNRAEQALHGFVEGRIRYSSPCSRTSFCSKLRQILLLLFVFLLHFFFPFSFFSSSFFFLGRKSESGDACSNDSGTWGHERREREREDSGSGSWKARASAERGKGGPRVVRDSMEFWDKEFIIRELSYLGPADTATIQTEVVHRVCTWARMKINEHAARVTKRREKKGRRNRKVSCHRLR